MGLKAMAYTGNFSEPLPFFGVREAQGPPMFWDRAGDISKGTYNHRNRLPCMTTGCVLALQEALQQIRGKTCMSSVSLAH